MIYTILVYTYVPHQDAQEGFDYLCGCGSFLAPLKCMGTCSSNKANTKPALLPVWYVLVYGFRLLQMYARRATRSPCPIERSARCGRVMFYPYHTALYIHHRTIVRRARARHGNESHKCVFVCTDRSFRAPHIFNPAARPRCFIEMLLAAVVSSMICTSASVYFFLRIY